MVTVMVDDIGPVPITVRESGDGHTYLLLHGGAAPQSVTAFADLLVETGHAKVIAPTHPGFAGTPRPDALSSIRGLAATYVALLDERNLTDVTVIGNSIGGWIAAEMAVLGSPRIGDVVLVDAVGIEVPDHPVVDFFSLTPAEIAERAYHDPDRFGVDPATMSPEQQEAAAGNLATLTVYGGKTMTDPGLRARLADVAVPTLVLWGDSDGFADVGYGRAFAAAIPGARFQVLADTGHLPQIESPDALLRAIREFTTTRERANMTDVSIVGPDDGEITLSGPVTMRILEDGGSTSHRLGLGEATLAPHTPGPPQHRHAEHDEGFYVVSGSIRFTVGDKSYDAGPRTLVMVPPGVPHSFANITDEPAVMLNTFTPDRYVNYFRDLRGLVDAGHELTPETLAPVMARYATEPATEFPPPRG